MMCREGRIERWEKPQSFGWIVPWTDASGLSKYTSLVRNIVCIISFLLLTCSQLGCKKQEVFGTWTGFSAYVLHSQTITRVSLSPHEGFQTHLETGWLKLQVLTSHISRFENFKINTLTNLLLGEIFMFGLKPPLWILKVERKIIYKMCRFIIVTFHPDNSFPMS